MDYDLALIWPHETQAIGLRFLCLAGATWSWRTYRAKPLEPRSYGSLLYIERKSLHETVSCCSQRIMISLGSSIMATTGFYLRNAQKVTPTIMCIMMIFDACKISTPFGVGAGLCIGKRSRVCRVHKSNTQFSMLASCDSKDTTWADNRQSAQYRQDSSRI